MIVSLHGHKFLGGFTAQQPPGRQNAEDQSWDLQNQNNHKPQFEL